MKIIVSSFAAATLALAASPAVAAPNHAQGKSQYSQTMKFAQNGKQNAAKPNHGKVVSSAAKSKSHRFAKGEKFDRSRASNYHVLEYRDYSRLSAPPRGYRWVRSGNDALLVNATSGIVQSVISSLF